MNIYHRSNAKFVNVVHLRLYKTIPQVTHVPRDSVRHKRSPGWRHGCELEGKAGFHKWRRAAAAQPPQATHPFLSFLSLSHQSCVPPSAFLPSHSIPPSPTTTMELSWATLSRATSTIAPSLLPFPHPLSSPVSISADSYSLSLSFLLLLKMPV